MTTTLWIAGAALLVLIAVWRLRRAHQTLETILREERAAEPDHSVDEPVRRDT